MHPYAKALLSAIPIPNIHIEKKKIEMKGELTSPIEPKPYCRFAPRCPYATEKCFQEQPELTDRGEGHYVMCHLK